MLKAKERKMGKYRRLLCRFLFWFERGFVTA
jgi:hypothetical protein